MVMYYIVVAFLSHLRSDARKTTYTTASKSYVELSCWTLDVCAFGGKRYFGVYIRNSVFYSSTLFIFQFFECHNKDCEYFRADMLCIFINSVHAVKQSISQYFPSFYIPLQR